MILLKDPAESLSQEDLSELVDENKEFDRWLKRQKKISNYPNARTDRDIRRETLRGLIRNASKLPTLKRIAEQIELAFLEGKQLDILQDIADFFQNRLGVQVRIPSAPAPPTSIEKEVIRPETVQPAVEAKVIGRVAPTLRTPASPTEFSLWVEDNENIHVETGSLVTARNQSGIRVTGLVSEIQAMSDIEGVLDSFYAHAFGRPEEEMSSKLPLVMSAKVEVVRRSDGRTEPVRGTWPVAFATAKEIREAYGAEISSEHEILSGFTYDDQGNPVPIGIDARYVIGYEAAHINIAGASGVATKTSYALFLLYGLLAYSEQHKGSVAAIAFNVKEADLMLIDLLPAKWEDLERWQHHARLGPSIRLWLQAKKDYGLDPIAWVQNQKFKFFAPMHFRPQGGVLSQRRDKVVQPFNYSLSTLIGSGVGSLYTLFDPEDLDEKALALMASMAEVAKTDSLTFESLTSKVGESLRRSDGRGDWFTFGNTTHHKATAHKILNRMRYALDNQLKGVVLKSESTDQPIPINDLRPGELWVIDITQLSDKGQRLVFQTIVRTVFQKLEERKSLELTVQLQGNLARFPRYVIIFVDELNKFVPAGREYSALKGDIVEMAARGRSIGMALCGAQQLASKVDEEVLANTSTFAVGRSHAVEIRKPPYAWLPEGLKERAMVLDKGWMLLWHTLHKRPVLIHFPLPLHRILEEIESMRR
ncbi:MAG: ATP-binding protein [Thermodesulfobacteriota bacterium]